MEQMKRFADNQLIIGDRFKITYYSTSDGEEITRIGRWDEKSSFRTSKAGDKLMIYYDEEKQGYRTAKNEWKLEAAEIIKNEKATKNLEEDKKMSENTVSPIFISPQMTLLNILHLRANATWGRLIIGDRFKITYYSASDGEEITRIGRWDEKSSFRTSKAGDKLMIYYDEEKQGYRTAKNEWKLEAAETEPIQFINDDFLMTQCKQVIEKMLTNGMSVDRICYIIKDYQLKYITMKIKEPELATHFTFEAWYKWTQSKQNEKP